MSKGRYSKTKMTNYFLISAILLISGVWKLIIMNTKNYPAETFSGDRGNVVFTSITAFLIFALIFMGMGVLHTVWHFKEKNKNL